MKTTARYLGAVTACLATMLATTIFAQQLGKPAATENETSKLVAKMISQYHLEQPEINDELSKKFLHGYIKDLDPQKLYFLKSDIDQFRRYETRLDDHLASGNVGVAHLIFDRFKERLDARMELAHSLIDQEHDFTVDESMVVDSDDLEWASTVEEINDRWRKRIKYELLQAKLEQAQREKDKKAGKTKKSSDEEASAQTEEETKDPVTQTREDLHRRYRNVLRNWSQLGEVDILEIYLTAMAETLDPHSSYMSPNTLEDFQISMKLSLDGIGAGLRADDGYTVVASIISGGAAGKDGRLQVGDKIIGVGDSADDIQNIVEMKLSDVVRLIRGARGTKVWLKVKKKETNETEVYVLTRQKIELTDAAVKGEIIEAQDRVGRVGKIGIISIPSFYRDFAGAQGGGEFKSAARDVANVLRDFRDQGGIDGIVIDLRRNGGGSLSEAIEISGQFIDRGPVVQVKEPSGRIRYHSDEDSGVLYSGPLAVVCNRMSASASEIFAGVIKDYNRGIVIGDTTTHGKGTVQNVMAVAPASLFRFNNVDRGALKLTIQQFYRVNGASTQNRGVPSDIVLPSLLDHLDLGEAFLDNAMAFDEIEPAPFTATPFVSAKIISQLQQASEQRVKENPEFQKVVRDIRRFLERKNRKTVSLNFETRLAEMEADMVDAEDALEKELGVDSGAEENPEDAPVFPEGYYNDEVLQITLDYVDALRAATAGLQ